MPLDLTDLHEYAHAGVGRFHEARLRRLQRLELSEILRKKNPYLFKAKNLNTAGERGVDQVRAKLGQQFPV